MLFTVDLKILVTLLFSLNFHVVGRSPCTLDMERDQTSWRAALNTCPVFVSTDNALEIKSFRINFAQSYRCPRCHCRSWYPSRTWDMDPFIESNGICRVLWFKSIFVFLNEDIVVCRYLGLIFFSIHNQFNQFLIVFGLGRFNLKRILVL